MNELITLDALQPLQVFTENGLDPLIDKVEKEARSIVLDISTEKGRKEVASLAHKIAKSKTALDKMGKDLVSGWKEQAKKVDTERAKAWDRLEALQKEIRQPLTEWEDRETARIARHEANLAEIESGGRYTLENWQTLPLDAMRDRLKEIEADAGLDWQEFCVRAKQTIAEASVSILSAIQKREAHDKDQAELARLRQEEAERKQREHEERLKAEAAAKAKAEAEEKARKEAEAEAARVKVEQEKAEQERLRIQREKDAAEDRAKKAEEDRIAAQQKAEADRMAAEVKADKERIAAAEQAKRDKEEADRRVAKVEAERKASEERAKAAATVAAEQAKLEAELAAKREREKIDAEKIAEAEATAKREADKKHKARVNNEALAALVKAGVPEDVGKKVVEAVAKKLVPHISIQY